MTSQRMIALTVTLCVTVMAAAAKARVSLFAIARVVATSISTSRSIGVDLGGP